MHGHGCVHTKIGVSDQKFCSEVRSIDDKKGQQRYISMKLKDDRVFSGKDHD